MTISKELELTIAADLIKAATGYEILISMLEHELKTQTIAEYILAIKSHPDYEGVI